MYMLDLSFLTIIFIFIKDTNPSPNKADFLMTVWNFLQSFLSQQVTQNLRFCG